MAYILIRKNKGTYYGKFIEHKYLGTLEEFQILKFGNFLSKEYTIEYSTNPTTIQRYTKVHYDGISPATILEQIFYWKYVPIF
jgi:hypothetical protein